MYLTIVKSKHVIYGYTMTKEKRKDVTPTVTKRQKTEICVTANKSTAPATSHWILVLNNPVSDYMRSLIEHLERPEALETVPLLCLDANPLGYEGSTQFSVRCGCLGRFAIMEKVKHPKCLIFVQKGSFYETIGVDAIVAMEVLGIKAMGGKPETGVPLKTIQFYLNRLTSAGLSVAVYEGTGGVRNRSQGKKTGTDHFSCITRPLFDEYDRGRLRDYTGSFTHYRRGSDERTNDSTRTRRLHF